MTHFSIIGARPRLTLLSLGVTLLVATACSEKGPVSPMTPEVAMDPPGLPGLFVANVYASTVTWISMAVGSMQEARNVVINNRASGKKLTVDMIDGGFDPVAIEAKVNDEINLTFTLATGEISETVLKVPARSRPGVVRTQPAGDGVDVALGSVVTVIFSEPVDLSSLTQSTFRLMTDGDLVEVRITAGANSREAEFVPVRPLTPLTSYEILVTKEVRNLNGYGPWAEYQSTFTTGRF